LEAALRTTGPGKKNTGRKFFSSPKYSTEPSNCKFFKWADELSGPGVPAIHLPKTPSKPPAAASSSKPREPGPSASKSVMEDLNISRTPQTTSIPATPETKPRDLVASERRLAIIRAAFASESQVVGSPIVERTPRAPDYKPNKRDAVNPQPNAGNLWVDGFEPQLQIAAKSASTFKDNSSGLVTPSRTPGTSMIAENMGAESLSPKRRRIEMDDTENNPFLGKSRHASAKSLDMSDLEARIAELVKERVEKACSVYKAELVLLHKQIEGLQAKVEALEDWRFHAESNGGIGT